jgi:prefoldin subunit 5
VTDDDIKTWVSRLVERSNLELEIDICQAEIEALKRRLETLQEALTKLDA